MSLALEDLDSGLLRIVHALTDSDPSLSSSAETSDTHNLHAVWPVLGRPIPQQFDVLPLPLSKRANSDSLVEAPSDDKIDNNNNNNYDNHDENHKSHDNSENENSILVIPDQTRPALSFSDPSHAHHRSPAPGEHVIGPQRRLSDTFGDSLRFVNRLYTIAFGKETRKAPAHMPHMIDKHIMAELQARWPGEYDATSSHRFRSGTDMQFSFSYFYYLMRQPANLSFESIFARELDINGNGELDQRELLTLSLSLNNGVRPPGDELKWLRGNLTDISVELGDEGRITARTVQAHNDLFEQIMDKFSSETKYKHTLETQDEIDFYMVPDDYEAVQLRLDEIRNNGHKFVCLNDDMNKTHDPDPRLLQALSEFYQSYFPLPCPFELPEGQLNPYLRLDQLQAAQAGSLVYHPWEWWTAVNAMWSYMQGLIGEVWFEPFISVSPLSLLLLMGLLILAWIDETPWF